MTPRKTMRIGPKGQVVIPKEVRDELGMKPGQEVIVTSSADTAVVRRLLPVSGLLGLLADGATTADLEQSRREDRDREERRIRDWNG